MVKVLISTIAIKDSPTGAFSRSFNLAKGLARNDHNVTLLTTQNNEFIFPFSKELRNGVLIIAAPSFFNTKIRKFGYDLMPTFLKFIYVLFKNYDIVHSDLYRPTSFIPCVIHHKVKKSILVSDWQDINGPSGLYDYKSRYWKCTIGPFDNWLELYSKKISDGIVVLSDLLEKKARQLGIEKNRTFKLWGGSDLDKIKFVCSTTINRRFFNIPNDDFVIVFVGLSSKDYEDNLNVFNAIKKINNKNIKIRILRTGKPFSAIFNKKYKIGNTIMDLGYIKDTDYNKLLSCANAFMLIQEPTNSNNLARWPNVIGDYLAAGRPIIMNLIGELLELEQKIPNAIIKIHSMDEGYLLKRFTEIYGAKSNLKKSYERISEYAIDNFSWDTRAIELEKIYTALNRMNNCKAHKLSNS